MPHTGTFQQERLCSLHTILCPQLRCCQQLAVTPTSSTQQLCFVPPSQNAQAPTAAIQRCGNREQRCLHAEHLDREQNACVTALQATASPLQLRYAMLPSRMACALCTPYLAPSSSAVSSWQSRQPAAHNLYTDPPQKKTTCVCSHALVR
jgi:hypothetical protein